MSVNKVNRGEEFSSELDEARKYQNAVPPPRTITVELTREQVCAISKLTCEKIDKINGIWTGLQKEEAILVEVQSAFKDAMSR